MSTRTTSLTRAILITALSLFTIATPALAQKSKSPEITDLGWMDKRHMEKQAQSIDDLARLHLGVQIRNDKTDLELIQRIINKGLIKKEERPLLQALGVVLGNRFVQDLGLQWKVYEDSVGRSRAVCIEDSQHCLFPITMLSRRMEVGLLPNVYDIYDNAASLIKPHLPKSPYDATP